MDFWSDFLYFFSFQDTNINNVLLGTIILGFTCGIVSLLVVLSKKALIVDAISHAVLPGICIGFMFTGVKNPIYLGIGGMAAGAVAVYLVDWISRISRIKKDASIAIALSVLFSLGVILLNIIQHSGNSNQSGLTDFLFGKAATIIQSDLYVFGVVFAIVVLVLIVFYQHLKIALFDAGFAKAIGLSEKLTQGLISGLVIISTAVGIQTVGIILMSALLITPASTSLFWTNNFKKAILLSGLFATLSSVIGVFISYLSSDMPTGPWIIVMLSFFALFSAFLSNQGVITKKIKTLNEKQRMLSDNLLKALYEIGLKNNEIKKARTLMEICDTYPISINDLRKGLRSLKMNKYLKSINDSFSLTDSGVDQAKNIIRAYIMQEIYMEKHMQVDPDRVHSILATGEHDITPEMEAEFIKKMDEKMNDLDNTSEK